MLLRCTDLKWVYFLCALLTCQQPAEWANRAWLLDAHRRRDALGPDRLKQLRLVPMLCFSAWESAGVDFVANNYHLDDVHNLVSDLIVEVKPCFAAARARLLTLMPGRSTLA